MTARIEQERLVAHVDGELDAAAARAVEAAMAVDSKLAETVAALRRDLTLVRAAYQEPLRVEVPERLVAAVDAAFAERQVARWHNPDSGSRGSVKPLRTFKISTGQWCREYVHAIDLQGWQERQGILRAIACREAGGRWKTRLELAEES